MTPAAAAWEPGVEATGVVAEEAVVAEAARALAARQAAPVGEHEVLLAEARAAAERSERTAVDLRKRLIVAGAEMATAVERAQRAETEMATAVERAQRAEAEMASAVERAEGSANEVASAVEGARAAEARAAETTTLAERLANQVRLSRRASSRPMHGPMRQPKATSSRWRRPATG